MNRTPVAVLAPLFPPATRGGGPIRTLAALVDSAPERFRVSVLASAREVGTAELLAVPQDQWIPRGAAEVMYTDTARVPTLLSALRALRSTSPKLLYINGFFGLRMSILPQLLALAGWWRGATRLVAPRGEFGAGALTRHPWRKRAFMAAYRLLRLHRQVVWHASTELERADIQKIWGRSAVVLVRENETSLPERSDPPPPHPGPARFVFISRLVPLKGLDVVLRALSQFPADVSAELDVYGPAENRAFVESCRRLAEQVPESVEIRWRGALAPEDVRSTLSGYDALVFPTAGENFGHVIPESLSVSTCVFVPPTTPWSADVSNGGGVLVADREPGSWVAALEEFARASSADRHAARLAAGAAFDRWRGAPKGPHVFDLALGLDR